MVFTSNRREIQHHRKMLLVCFGNDTGAISLLGLLTNLGLCLEARRRVKCRNRG
jgi:hypothetical protein